MKIHSHILGYTIYQPVQDLLDPQHLAKKMNWYGSWKSLSLLHRPKTRDPQRRMLAPGKSELLGFAVTLRCALHCLPLPFAFKQVGGGAFLSIARVEETSLHTHPSSKPSLPNSTCLSLTNSSVGCQQGPMAPNEERDPKLGPGFLWLPLKAKQGIPKTIPAKENTALSITRNPGEACSGYVFF